MVEVWVHELQGGFDMQHRWARQGAMLDQLGADDAAMMGGCRVRGARGWVEPAAARVGRQGGSWLLAGGCKVRLAGTSFQTLIYSMAQ